MRAAMFSQHPSEKESQGATTMVMAIRIFSKRVRKGQRRT